jgi:hypothetical protein
LTGVACARDDCGERETCVPHIGYVSTTHCAPVECVSSSECEPGFICAPVYVDEIAGNHLERFDRVKCIPDPDTCTSS